MKKSEWVLFSVLFLVILVIIIFLFGSLLYSFNYLMDKEYLNFLYLFFLSLFWLLVMYNNEPFSWVFQILNLKK